MIFGRIGLLLLTLGLILPAPLAAQVIDRLQRQQPIDAVRKPILAPPPVVTRWLPGTTRLLPGQEIRVEGQELQPGVRVSIGNQKLQIVRATPTLVIARAPHRDDTAFPYIKGPLQVAHPAGQPRVLHSRVEVIDPWNSLTPRVAALTREGGAVWGEGNSRLYQTFRVVIDDLPGDRLVSLEGDPRNSGCTLYGAQSSGQSDQHFSGFRLDRRITIGVGVPQTASSGKFHCRVALTVKTRYDQNPGDVRSRSVDLNYVEFHLPVDTRPTRTFRITSTAQLRQYFHFVEPTALNGVGTCSGDSFGTPVGLITEGGDLALRIRSGPIGTTCPWSLKGIGPLRTDIYPNAHALARGWSVERLEWVETTRGTHCVVSRDGAARDMRVMKVSFGRGTLFMGWQAIGAGEYRDANSREVFLTCSPTPLNDNEVTARLDAVVLRGPADATDWREAFR